MSESEAGAPLTTQTDVPADAETAVDGSAIRGAQAISDRIAADEAAADDARDRYQAEGLPVIEADARYPGPAFDDEHIHAIHLNAMLEPAPGSAGRPQPLGGTLYVTSRRIVHAGTAVTAQALDDIEEADVVLERLVLLRLRGNGDLAIEVDKPRLLRVQIAAARAALRSSRA